MIINTTRPVILSFTTIPERIQKSTAIVKDILTNIDGFEYLIVNIPKIYKTFSWNLSDKDLEELKNIRDRRLIINRTDDYGPLTKLLGTLQRFPIKDAILIIFDDNFYHHEAFKIIAEKQDENTNKSFTYYKYKYNNEPLLGSAAKRCIDVAQGVDMISFWLSNLQHFRDYYNQIKHNKYCFYVDDLVISNYLKEQNIPIEQLQRKWKWAWKQDDSAPTGRVFELFKIKGIYSRDNSMRMCYNELNKGVDCSIL